MKLRMIARLALFVALSVITDVRPTAQEPTPQEQPQGVLKQLADGVVIAIGSTGQNGMNMKGYLKYNPATQGLLLVADYQDTPEFKFTVRRSNNYIGLQSLANNKFLGSSVATPISYGLKFNYNDMSTQNAQFVLKGTDQAGLNGLWLYNRATQGFISVRDRADEIVTYDHTRTGAQPSIFEKLFIELKSATSSSPSPAPAPVTPPAPAVVTPPVATLAAAPAPVRPPVPVVPPAPVTPPAPVVPPAAPAAPAPVEVAGKTQADYEAALKQLQQALVELNQLRNQFNQLNASYVAQSQSASSSQPLSSTSIALRQQLDDLRSKVAAAQANRDDLFNKLMQALDQLHSLTAQANASGSVSPQAVMQAAATATAAATAPSSVAPSSTATSASVPSVATTPATTPATPAVPAGQSGAQATAPAAAPSTTQKTKKAAKKKAAKKKVSKKKAAKKKSSRAQSTSKKASKKSARTKSTKKKVVKKKKAKKRTASAA